MNTFRKGDRVKVRGVEYTVNSTDGALVFLKGAGCVHYTDVQRVGENKFLPGDIVRYRDGDNYERRIIKCLINTTEPRSYAYVNSIGWDYEHTLVLVHRPADDLDISRNLTNGRLLYAIKAFRSRYSFDLKESKGAVEAMRDALPDSAETSPPSTFAIVARKVGDTYSPSGNPVVHASDDLAVMEAERLAKCNPGVEFGTFVLSHRSKASNPIVTTVKA